MKSGQTWLARTFGLSEIEARRWRSGFAAAAVALAFLVVMLWAAKAALEFVACVNDVHLAFVKDHRVSDRVLFPGAGFLELCSTALHLISGDSQTLLSVTDVAISAPLILANTAERTYVSTVVDEVAGMVSVCAAGMHKTAMVKAHWRALVKKTASAAAQHSGTISAFADGSLLASGALQTDAAAMQGFITHPAVLDAGLHLLAAADMQVLRIPVCAAVWLVREPFAAEMRTCARIRSGHGTSTFSDHAYRSCGAATMGLPAALLRQLETRQIGTSAGGNRSERDLSRRDAGSEHVLYSVQWAALLPRDEQLRACSQRRRQAPVATAASHSGS